MTRRSFLAAFTLVSAAVLALTFMVGSPTYDALHPSSTSDTPSVAAEPLVVGPPGGSSGASDRSEIQPNNPALGAEGGILVSVFDALNKMPLRAACIAFGSDGSVTTFDAPHIYSFEAAASISSVHVSAAGYSRVLIQGDRLRNAADKGRVDVYLEGDRLTRVHFYLDAKGAEPAEGVVLRRIASYTRSAPISDLDTDITHLPALRTSDERGAVQIHISGPVLADFEYPQGKFLRLLILQDQDAYVYLGDYVETEVRFLDVSQGRPLQGLAVALSQTGRRGASTIVGGCTDANGRLRLSLQAETVLIDTMPPINLNSVAQEGSSPSVAPIRHGRCAVTALRPGAEVTFGCATGSLMWRLVDSRTGKPVEDEARAGFERPLQDDSYFGLRERTPTPVRGGVLFVSLSLLESWQAQPLGARFVVLVPGYNPWILRRGDPVPADGSALMLDPGELRSLRLRWRDGSPVVDHVDVYRVEHNDAVRLLPGSGLSPKGWMGRFVWTGGRIVVVLRSAGISKQVSEQELRASREIEVRLDQDPSVVRVEGVPPLIEDVVILSAHDGIYADLQGSAIPLFSVGIPGVYQAENVPSGKYYLGRRDYVVWQRALGERSELNQYLEVEEGKQLTLQWRGLRTLDEAQTIRVLAPPDVRSQLIFQPVFESATRPSYTLSPPPFRRTEAGDILLPRGAPAPSAVLASVAAMGFSSNDRFVVPVGIYDVGDELVIQGDPLRVRCLDSDQLTGELVILRIDCASAVVGPFQRFFFDTSFQMECIPGTELSIPLIGGPEVAVQGFVEGGRRRLSTSSPIFVDGAWQVTVSP